MRRLVFVVGGEADVSIGCRIEDSLDLVITKVHDN